jgi:hypothetical protein
VPTIVVLGIVDFQNCKYYDGCGLYLLFIKLLNIIGNWNDLSRAFAHSAFSTYYRLQNVWKESRPLDSPLWIRHCQQVVFMEHDLLMQIEDLK